MRVRLRTVIAVSFVAMVGFASLVAGQHELSASEAAARAAQLANAESQRRFGHTPFTPSAATAVLIEGRWHWRAMAGQRYSDLRADISFSVLGDAPKVHVELLDTRRN